MRLTRTTAWAAGTAVLCVALLVAAWFLLISPQRAAAAEARAATEAARTQNGQLQLRITELETEFAQLPQRRAELAAIRLALPAERGLAALLDELDVVADETATTLASVVAGTPTTVLDAAAPTTAPSPTTEEPAPADGGTAPQTSAAPVSPYRLAAGAAPAGPTAAATPDPAAGGSADPAGAPGEPVLAAVPVTVTVGGDFLGVAQFVRTAQTDLDRALVVDSLDIATATDPPGSVTATLTGRVFVFVDPGSVDLDGDPAASDQAPGAAPTGPTTGPTTGLNPEATDE